MYFTIIDALTGLYPNIQEIDKEEWCRKGIYRDEDGNIAFRVSPLISLEGFAITEEGLILAYDKCSNYSYPPEGRFLVEWL